MTTKTEKLPSFKDVVLKRLWWIDRDGQPLPGKPPLWSLGGHFDVDAMDYAIACIDGESNVPEMAETVAAFPGRREEGLPTPLAYLRLVYLMMDYVAEHEEDEPDCQWDEDDDDMDAMSPFRIMHIVEAAYRMGYVDGQRAVEKDSKGD
jgi:hypothetical protein